MTREGIIPGWEGRYKIVIDDASCRCINVESGKPLKNRVGNKNPAVTWRLVIGDKSLIMMAEKFIQMTFPGIERRDYIRQLYKGCHNLPRVRTRRIDLNDDIYLENLYTPYAYCITLPLDMDISKDIKKLFPGPVFNVEGSENLCNRREIYFRSEYHIVVVETILKDFLGIS